MRRFGWIGAALALGWTAAPSVAHADPCSHFGYGMPTGPVVAPVFDGGLGRGYRVCGRSEVGLRAGGLILVDRPNFYGRVSAGGTLEGSWAPGKYGEVFAGAELVRYDTVIESLTSSAFGFGHMYVGGSYRMVTSERLSLGFNGKLVFPTASALYQEARPFGFDFGMVGHFAAHPKVHIRGQLGLMASAMSGHAGPGFRMGASITGGAEFLPIRRFGIATDLVTVLGYSAIVDYFAGAVAFRFSNLKRFGFELAGTFPFAGRERAQAVVMLRASVRLGGISTPPRGGLRKAPKATQAPPPKSPPVMKKTEAVAPEPVEPEPEPETTPGPAAEATSETPP